MSCPSDLSTPEYAPNHAPPAAPAALPPRGDTLTESTPTGPGARKPGSKGPAICPVNLAGPAKPQVKTGTQNARNEPREPSSRTRVVRVFLYRVVGDERGEV